MRNFVWDRKHYYEGVATQKQQHQHHLSVGATTQNVIITMCLYIVRIVHNFDWTQNTIEFLIFLSFGIYCSPIYAWFLYNRCWQHQPYTIWMHRNCMKKLWNCFWKKNGKLHVNWLINESMFGCVRYALVISFQCNWILLFLFKRRTTFSLRNVKRHYIFVCACVHVTHKLFYNLNSILSRFFCTHSHFLSFYRSLLFLH